MNPDRFRAETAPYFRNPALEGRFSDPRYGAELEGPVYGGEPSGLPPQSAYYAEMYGPKVDEGFNIPAVPYQQIDARFYRQQVPNTFGERPGTIIVDTGERFLYLI
jgi:lipoprotein-anchoring transpeptidase ErfK/SrfK